MQDTGKKIINTYAISKSSGTAKKEESNLLDVLVIYHYYLSLFIYKKILFH